MIMKQPTLKQACESLLKVNDPSDYGYDDTCLYKIYMSEYGEHFGFTQQAVTEWIKGLPSVFSFPIYNSEIIKLITDTGYPMHKHREATLYKIVDLYWWHIGYAAYKHLNKLKGKGV